MNAGDFVWIADVLADRGDVLFQTEVFDAADGYIAHVASVIALFTKPGYGRADAFRVLGADEREQRFAADFDIFIGKTFVKFIQCRFAVRVAGATKCGSKVLRGECSEARLFGWIIEELLI